MVDADPTDAHGNLFPIFLLSLIQFFLAPITLWRVGSWVLDLAYGGGEKKSPAAAPALAGPADASSEWGKAAAARAARERPTALRKLRSQFTGANLVVWIFWGVSALLVAYIALSNVEEQEVFDPYKVLNLPVGADAAAIKKAYRSLSLQYHPDKNPDPEAHKFFTESITPAYKTLTDETARENYEKYGHPDGKQSPKLGVALPQWMFGKDGTGPIVLIVLVAGGILAPLGLAVVTILRLNRYSGASGILRQSQYYFHTQMKPHLSLRQVPRVLSVAAEYIQIPCSEEQKDKVKRLFATLKSEYDTKDPKFMMRHAPILKAHALLLAQACRKTADLDPALRADLKAVMKLFPALFQEAFKISLSPVNPVGYSFMRPALSFLEFSQCVTQAVSPSARNKGSDGSGWVSLLQLPHVDEKIAAALGRKKIRGVSDLAATPGAAERAAALTAAGLSESQATDVETHLAFFPRPDVFTATVETDGEDNVLELDVVTCAVTLKLSRGGAPEKKEGDEKGTPAPGAWGSPADSGLVIAGREDLPPLPFCEHCEREEGWFVIVADPAANFIFAYKRLDEKTVVAAQRESKGVTTDLKFQLPTAGAYQMHVMLVSDYWLGADAKWVCKVKVAKRTKELLEARAAKAAGKSAKPAKKGDGDAEADETPPLEGESGSDSDYSDSDDEGREHDPDYPSEETGTEESSDEEEEEDRRARAARQQATTPAAPGSAGKPGAGLKPGPATPGAAAAKAKEPEAKPAESESSAANDAE